MGEGGFLTSSIFYRRRLAPPRCPSSIPGGVVEKDAVPPPVEVRDADCLQEALRLSAMVRPANSLLLLLLCLPLPFPSSPPPHLPSPSLYPISLSHIPCLALPRSTHTPSPPHCRLLPDSTHRLTSHPHHSYLVCPAFFVSASLSPYLLFIFTPSIFLRGIHSASPTGAEYMVVGCFGQLVACSRRTGKGVGRFACLSKRPTPIHHFKSNPSMDWFLWLCQIAICGFTVFTF